MIRIIAISILATAFLGLSRPSAAGEKAQPHVSSEDEEAVRAFVIERIESFNKHEAPRSTAFTQDADFVNVYGMLRKGPDEIERRQKERMQTVLKDANIALQDLRIRFIKPDVAIVHETHEMSGMRNDQGETMPPHQELGIRVMVKEQGKWLTTAFHNTIVRPVEPPPEVVVEGFVRAWNTHDATGLGDVFSEDADWVTASGMQVRGRNAIQAALAKEHANWAKTTSMAVTSTTTRRIGPNDVVLYFNWKITGAVGDNGKSAGPFHGVNLFVVTRQSAGWKVVAGQATKAPSS